VKIIHKLTPRIWDTSQSVGIDIFDKHHKNFLGVINSLIEAINSKQCADKIVEILHKVIYYAENYFIDEEIFFKKYKYPKLNEHKESHAQFINEINGFMQMLKGGNTEICFEILDFMDKWYKNHLSKYDQDAINFLKEKGVK
jgi:hemerythrin-like metal-binding protein